jgi:capsular exopolysaccharide synthesis family protein
MGIFKNFASKMSFQSHANRASKASKKHKRRSMRADYLLSKDTPFEITEAFRNLKATLSVSIPKKERGISIMVTSSFPEEGKTTVTANLAYMFAQSDAKVVLVDADIRKGRVAKYFKRKSSPGLSDCLSGQNTLDEIIYQSEINENFSYITCGTHAPRPYELLESEEMKKILDELSQRFDYIIIDTPPILMVSDALAVAPSTDGCILVSRHQVSYISDIERAINTLKFSKANFLGVVVNDYKALKTSIRGSYKKYYYYNSYGYGYGSTNPEDKDDKEIN